MPSWLFFSPTNALCKNFQNEASRLFFLADYKSGASSPLQISRKPHSSTTRVSAGGGGGQVKGVKGDNPPIMK